MSTDIWTGTGDWNLNPSHWSIGAAPTANQNADIDGDDTLSTSGVAGSLQIEGVGALLTGPSATLTLSGYLANATSASDLQGQVSVAGDLLNSGAMLVSALTAATSVSVGNLVNNGTLKVQGAANGGSPQAILTVNAAPTAGFSGTIAISGNARLQYTGAGASSVTQGGSLEIVGAAAAVTLAGVSALATLSTNFGQLYLRGDTSLGAGGVSATIGGAYLTTGTTGIDDAAGSGGSRITIGAALTVAGGSTTIGNSTLSAATSVNVASLRNEGALKVLGNAASHVAAKLTVNSAAPLTLTGGLEVAGDASIAFSSGTITSVQTDSSVLLEGANAQVLSNATSALATLATNFGTIDLEGGAALQISASPRNFDDVSVDADDSAGGSHLTITGTLTNNSRLYIGNAHLGASDVLQVANLTNQGVISLQSASNNSAQALLSVTSAASSNLVGAVTVSGNADLSYANGQIANIQDGASLQLYGADAKATSGGASALGGLQYNYGILSFQGDDVSNNLDGAQVTTTGAFTNSSEFEVDTGYAGGDSNVTFAGAITNYSLIDPAAIGGQPGFSIGNSELSGPTIVHGASLLNEGYLSIQGNASSNVAATLAISGVANPSLTGLVQIAGDAMLQYGSGAITNIQAGSSLRLYGGGARILSGTQSALSAPASNFGNIVLNDSETSYGAGGATLAITGALTNYGQIQIDDDYLASGSDLKVGGAFTNDRNVLFGNASGVISPSPAPSLLQVGALTNNGYFDIGYGDPSEMSASGAAANNGWLGIAALSSLAVQNGAAFTQNSGLTWVIGALSASQVILNGGEMEFATGLTSDDAIAAFNIGAAGQLVFDGSVDARRTVSFTASAGSLQVNPSVFAGVIAGFGATEVIDLSSLNLSEIVSYSYAGNSSSGALTLNLSGGGADTLHFSGNYAKSSFLLVPDGYGGTEIQRNVAQDIRSGSGDWDADPGGWSAAAPPAGKNAIIAANSSVTASQVDNVGATTLLDQADLTAASGSTLTVASSLNNFGNIYFQAAHSTVSGTLINNSSATVTVSTAAGGSAVTASVAGLNNHGALTIAGGGAPSGPKATLAVGGYSTSVIYGSLTLEGDAALTFGSGAFTTVGDDATLTLYGGQTQITGGGVSALAGLSANFGTINLEGDYNGDAGGVSLQINGAFLNANSLDIDGYSGGGDQIAFAGAFTNTGQLTIGNGDLLDDTLVSVGSLNNQGRLYISGAATLTSPHGATLSVNGAAPSALSGDIMISGDARLQYASGVIQTIQYGSSLHLNGANAQILANRVSALSGLTTNAGTLDFEGDQSGLGEGGVTLTTTANFNNFGELHIDAEYDGGGSVITIAGAFLNGGEATIGDDTLTASTTLSVNSLVNEGSLDIVGVADLSSPQALVKVTSAAPGALTGQWVLSGHAALDFLGGGQIATIQYGASLELEGEFAEIISGQSTSALLGLSVNAGVLSLFGGTSVGVGGVVLNTTTALTNSGEINIDMLGSGGSAVDFGGTLTNTGSIFIGDDQISDSVQVTVASLINEGSLSLRGSAAASATMTVDTAASGAFTGNVSLAGEAVLDYIAAGGFTQVQAGSRLSLTGSGAQIVSGGVSALATLTANYGDINLDGDAYHGLGGASLIVDQGFTNYGGFALDYGYYGGGSSAVIEGALTNDGTLSIGYDDLTAMSTLAANGVINNGSIVVTGASTAAAALLSNGNFYNRGQIIAQSGGEIEASDAAYVQYSGTTTLYAGAQLLASTVDAFGGAIDIIGDVASGDGLGGFIVNGVGELEFDGSVDPSHSVTFTQAGGVLTLGDSSRFFGVVRGFSGTDSIDLIGASISSFAYSGSASSGTLTVQTSAGAASLSFAGDFDTNSFTTMSDGAGGTKLLFA